MGSLWLVYNYKEIPRISEVITYEISYVIQYETMSEMALVGFPKK